MHTIMLLPLFCLWQMTLPYLAHYLLHRSWENILKNQPMITLIHIFTAILTFFLLNQPLNFNVAVQATCISALQITILTDSISLLISRFVCLYLIPFNFIATSLHLLPITLEESILGATIGYGILWITNQIFKLIRKHDGIGQGDLELLAFIGSFTGPIGAWASLTIGSTIGCIAVLIYAVLSKKRIKIVPFGAFLALGSILTDFFCFFC